MFKKLASLGCVAMALGAGVSSAKAEVNQGDLRLSLDTSLLTVGRVKPEGDDKVTYFGFGPGAIGGEALLNAPTSFVGLGFGYSLSEHVSAGARFGFGYTKLNGDDEEGDGYKLWNLDLEPELRLFPAPHQNSVFFVSLAPVLSYAGSGSDGYDGSQLLYGGSIALGESFFVAEKVSFDVSIGAQIRTGSTETSFDDEDFEDLGTEKQDVNDVRGIVRIGISHWR